MKPKALAWLIAPIYSLYARTLRIRFFGYPQFKAPVVYFFWHDSLFPLIWTHRGKGVTVMVSEHPDGELAAQVLRRFGFGLARGSARRGALKAAKALVEAAKKGFSVAITPDGPVGPRRQFKEGAWKLGKALGLPLIAVGVAYSHFWELGSWDRFRLPKPFAKVAIYLEEIPPELSAAEAGEFLNQANRKAESLL